MGVVGVLKQNYNPREVEEEVSRFWSENRIYEKVKKWSMKFEREFKFIDGPPYPSSGLPHVGTSWNKVLKDSILRFRRMRGYRVHDQPGYDCHGLPIEVAVEKMLGTKSKRDIESIIGVENFINKCKSIVLSNIAEMTKWFKSLGVFMDWENPYLTMNDEYIESGWWLIKKASSMGLLVNEERVVYWCPRCSTTLAEYEVEYREIEDPSIYVKFRVKGRENEYILIWTTTPWTLPANEFVMVKPSASYARVRVGDEVFIMAEARVEAVMSEAGVKKYEVIERIPGEKLVGLEYEHPLEDLVPLQSRVKKYHRIYPAEEFVTLTEGTGLVHSAPGHGFEDFIVASRVGVKEAVSPVDDEGKFTSEAGRYAGVGVREANADIIRDLRERKALFHEGVVKHRYPVCWRCKTPVILRAKKQWVLKITRLKKKLEEEVRRARWVPEWALDRIMNMIENLQDWVISRQRYWGTPLPIWVCENGHTLVIGSVDELVKHGGFKPKELHRPWIDEVELKCPVCGGVMRRVPDVMDVWFDSGIAFYASITHPSRIESSSVQADFITEGHDQTRGWFFSLLRAGVLGFNQVPYKTVLVHGFALDEEGREMHKSLGNYIGTDEVLEKTGADVFRLAVLQNTVWEDLRFSWRLLNEAKRDLSVAWNVFVFASTYMNMDGFDPSRNRVEDYISDLRFEDKWILSRLYSLVEKVTSAFEDYRVHEAARLLREFIVEDVSHWYVRIIRPRVWVEENTRDKFTAYATLYEVLETWLKLAAPIIPFFTEKIYQVFVKKALPEYPESIHMIEWPRVKRGFIDEEIEREMSVIRELFEATAAARMKVKLKLRQPVKRVIIYTSNESVKNVVLKHNELLKKILNSKEVVVREPKLISEVITYRVEPNYKSIGPRYRSFAGKVIRYIMENQSIVAKDLIEKGLHKTAIDGVEVVIEKKDANVIPVEASGYGVQETDWGSVAVDTRLSIEEVADGLARDIVRRVQAMRKELDLPMNARVKVEIKAPEEMIELIKSRLEYISGEVRASEVIVDSRIKPTGDLVRKWEIQGSVYEIGVKRVS